MSHFFNVTEHVAIEYDYLLHLPLPPTTNHYHVPITFKKRELNKKTGKYEIKIKARNIVSPDVQKYKNMVVAMLYELKLAHKNLHGAYIGLIIHQKQNRIYDCDNFLKAPVDALVQAQFLTDDHLVEWDFIRHAEKRKGGSIDLYIRKHPNPDHYLK